MFVSPAEGGLQLKKFIKATQPNQPEHKNIFEYYFALIVCGKGWTNTQLPLPNLEEELTYSSNNLHHCGSISTGLAFSIHSNGEAAW